MTDKYTKAKFMEDIKALTSPYENKQNGQGKLGGLRGLAERIKQLALKNRGVKPE